MTKPTVKSEWGLCCPKCGRDDGLEIEIKTDVILGTQEWDADSLCYCNYCGKVAEVYQFDCS